MATSSGLPRRILSRAWRILSWPLALAFDLWTPFDLFGWGGRAPKGFWSEARTGSTPRPRKAAPDPGSTASTAPPPPPHQDFFAGGDR